MDAGTKIAAVASGILMVAIVAVLVSQNAQTGTVLTSAGQAFSQVLSVAVSPVAGGAGTLTSGLSQSLSPLSGGLFGSAGSGF